MANIMLVEDDDTLQFGIQMALKKNGYGTIVCPNLEQARSLFSPQVDLILLDLNLPDGSGYDFCGWVKRRSDTPILFLTVRDDETDMVKGLDMGADDYIVKPFSITVLLSRIRAVMRRVAQTEETQLLTCGTLILNKEARTVHLDGKELILTAGEYRLLLCLMENKNQTLTRQQLLEKVWDVDGSFVGDNALTVTMRRLREKLQGYEFIRTLREIGYRMEEEPWFKNAEDGER